MPCKFKTATHFRGGRPRAKSQAFPIIEKKHLPKLNIPKELKSASKILRESQKEKIGDSRPTGGPPKGPTVALGKFKVSKESIRWAEQRAKSRGTNGRLVMMSPDEFLRRSPSMVTAAAPASLQRKEHYSKSSLDYIRNVIRQGKPVEVPFLDYTDMRAGWPTHDGRHRAFIAKEMHIPRVPVYVIGEKEVKV